MQADEARSPSSAPASDAADALTAVVHSATAVARAEVRLVAAEGKAWLTRIGLSIGLLWLSLSLLQLFVLLLALTPVLWKDHDWTALGLMLLLPLVPALSLGLLGWRQLRRLKEPGNGTDSRQDQSN